MEINNNKVCSKCKKEKPFSDFYNKSCTKDGKNSQCRQCRLNYVHTNRDAILKTRRKYNNKNRDILRRKGAARWHGMTLEEYDSFFAVRNHRCEVCGLSGEESYKLLNKTLDIDHCHETGENKGLLCGLCNPASGMLKDNPDLAFKLWKYLERTRRKEG